MSTQKRENRFRSTNCTERAPARTFISPAEAARQVCARTGGGTAPLMSILWVAFAWMATKFLHADQMFRLPVQPRTRAGRPGSPPKPAPPGQVHGLPVSPQSFLPPIPVLSGSLPLPVTLPHAPAAKERRAERQDGKRDLYFLHAA